MPKDVEIAWLAGLLEGEGCFSLDKTYQTRKGPRSYIRVAVNMSDRDVLERAAALMGAPKVLTFGPRTDPATNRDPSTWSTMYGIRAGGVQAEHVMRLVRPYMGQRRGAKIDALLALPNLSHRPDERKFKSCS